MLFYFIPILPHVCLIEAEGPLNWDIYMYIYIYIYIFKYS